MLQEKGMWVEALKSCREYLPGKLDEVQADYDRECGARVSRDINSLFVQASQWEQNGEFKTAVDCLLKVNAKIQVVRLGLYWSQTAAMSNGSHIDFIVNMLLCLRDHPFKFLSQLGIPFFSSVLPPLPPPPS